MPQVLLGGGASKSVKNIDGHTPYDIICFTRSCSDSTRSELESLLSPSTKGA